MIGGQKLIQRVGRVVRVTHNTGRNDCESHCRYRSDCACVDLTVDCKLRCECTATGDRPLVDYAAFSTVAPALSDSVPATG